MIAQSKRVRAGSLAIVDLPQVARTFILRADVMLSFSGVTYVLFCFRIFASTEAAALRSTLLRQPHAVS